MARPEVYKKRSYLGISDGFITENATEDTPGAVKKVSTKGKVYYELQYPYWNGIVTSIKLFEKEHEGQVFKSWNITLEDVDDGEEYVLSVPMNSGNTSSLYNKLENADLSKEVKIMPYNFVGENQKKVVGLNVFQGDNKMEPTYTKESPCPVQPRAKTGADAGKWDYSAVNEYMSGKFLELADKVAQMNPTGGTPATKETSGDHLADNTTPPQSEGTGAMQPNTNAEVDMQTEVQDDLPF